MKRFKLYRGAMHEDDSGPYVLHDDVINLFNPSNEPGANIHPQLFEILNDIGAIRCSQKYEYDKGWGHMNLYLVKNTEGDCLKYEEVKAIIEKHFGERVTS